eukprot:TRINITY_DN26110_c0_g2_i1.p1 TRINITY_DN26110_c0_g2~~TRINITY_DN26110_c0_g2_i1.p1  ORF type:complete len:346 (+),score=85.45 TRINITY_DN26110_c0_g2_i1:55-1038(+)
MGNAISQALDVAPCCAGHCGDQATEQTAGSVPAGAYVVVLDKTSGGKLGLDVSPAADGSLLIKGVTGGLAEAWSKGNPSKAIVPNDRIIEVNGSNTASDMLQRCKTDKVLKFIVKRTAAAGGGAGASSAGAGASAGNVEEVNAGYLIKMTEMGIPENRARGALLQTRNDLQAAIDLAGDSVAANPQMAPENAEVLIPVSPAPPAPASPPPAAASAGAAPDAGNSVDQLTAMGFTREQAQSALAANGNNLDQAISWLMDGGDATAAAVAEAAAEPAAQYGRAPEASSGDRDKIQQLVNMGFDEESAKLSLDAHNGNVERAADYLLSQS